MKEEEAQRTQKGYEWRKRVDRKIIVSTAVTAAGAASTLRQATTGPSPSLLSEQ